MNFFVVLGTLFLAGAVYNLFKGDYPNMAVGLCISTLLFVAYFSRRRKATQDAAMRAMDLDSLPCCKCGGWIHVRLRTYLLAYSIIFYSSKSPGAIKPVCDSCSVIAGLPYSFFTLLFGWWGIPHGPIYTIQALYRNFKGGVIIANPKR